MKDLLDDVVPKIPIKDKKDRPKFIAVWLVAGLLILAYAIWLAIKVADSYEHPGAQIGVDPTQPPYPVFAVCFWQLDPNATVKVSALHTITKGSDSTYTGFTYSEFLPRYFEQDGETYSRCIQFNNGGNTTVKANKGNLELIVQAAYPSTTLHASVDLLVLPAGKGFNDDTDPETWDNIILATDSYVDARWTAQRKIDVHGKQTMRYQLVSQVEPLTHERKRSLTSTTEFIEGLSQCGDDEQQGDTCTVNTRTGVCRDNECQFECPDLTTIPLTYLCDFFNDCPGGEDEVGCPAGFDCAGDGSQFVPMSAQCNGIDDCDDSQDEENCDNYPLFVGATIQPYTQYVTVTEDYVSFGWETFFASLASGWSIIGVGIAFFFPEETATYLRWRGTKAKEEEENGSGKKEKEKEKPEAAEMKTLTSAPQSPDESAKPDEEV